MFRFDKLENGKYEPNEIETEKTIKKQNKDKGKKNIYLYCYAHHKALNKFAEKYEVDDMWKKLAE